MIAKHVMNIHMNRPNQLTDGDGEDIGEIDINTMKRYIAYCKAWDTQSNSFLCFVTECRK